MAPKVILINLPPALDCDFSSVGTVYPATGILLIGSIMKIKGVSVQLIDCALYKDYEQRVLAAIDGDTAMVCFSVMTSQVTMALNLSEKIKAKKNIISIVWGGIHTILFLQQTVSNPNIDIAVTGDGVSTTADLIDYLSGKINLKQIRGIGFKDAGGKIVITDQSEPDDINNIPYIDYSLLDNPETYLNAGSVYEREIKTDNGEKVRLMPVLTALGCCYKCRFCINSFLERKYRFKSAQSIVDEIKKLQKQYNANAFLFLDEDFPVSKKRLLEFLELIEKENLKFYWRIWGRVSYFHEKYINRELVVRLEKNGLRSIAMGAESGSQRTLDLIQKQIKTEDILRSAKLLNNTKITARYSFIVGLEGEIKEDVKDTYALCVDLMDINPRVDIAGPFVFRYYPGSPLFENIVKNYNIKLPHKIEDWKDSLSDDGFLKMDEMPWLWDGFERSVARANKYVWIYESINKTHKLIGKLMKILIRWRIKNLYMEVPLEIYMFDMLVKFMNAVKKKELP